MSHAKNKVRWCVNKARKELEKGSVHRGLVETPANVQKARDHATKAEHNLKTTLYLRKGNFTDWCSSTLFYTIYHCFLAILAKHGYESRNQECTFAAIHKLIEENTIKLNKEDVEKITSLDVEQKHHTTNVVSIREEYQYSTKLSLQDTTLSELVELAKEVLDQTKLIISG